MGETTIEWTDKTWNPVTGCTKVSAGCKNCYAERVFPRAYKQTGRKFTDVAMHADRLEQPLHWRKPARVFVNSMSDLFHEDVPNIFIDQIFATMALAPQHTFQILTKRPACMLDYLRRPGKVADIAVDVFKRFSTLRKADVQSRKAVETWPLPNVWLGVSVEDQKNADERIPLLLQTPAAVRFVSYEPALGPVEFDCGPGRSGPHRYFSVEVDHPEDQRLDWVIVGGESGPGARPFNIQWARDAIAQCQAAGVAVFVKQLGAAPFLEYSRSYRKETPGLKLSIQQLEVDTTISLGDRKGGDPAEWPSDLRVREFPQ